MDDLIKMLEGFIQSASAGQIKRQVKQNWKYCIVLIAKGWEVKECLKVPETNDITIRWIKSGEKEIILKLSLHDQRKWIEYLERRKNGKSI